MTDGVSTALAQVLDGSADADVLRQAGLFDDLDVAEIGALEAPSPLSPAVAGELADAVRTRRRGRPPGSPNRRTDATVRWLLAQNRHPLAVMAEAYAMTPKALCERIGIAATDAALLEVFKLQMRMAEAVAPYVAQRLPQAVEVQSRHDFRLVVDAGVSLPARGQLAGNGEAIDAPFGVVLASKSDDASRTDI